jgi:phosphoribosylformylglycinamidine cyclo-ligase
MPHTTRTPGKPELTDQYPPEKGLSYRDAGVDIDAGNALVDMIKPLVATTTRPEVVTGIGGFGGMFRLDASRFREPVLVSGTDGVGTKLLLARQLGVHDSIGIDLVAMCVNDILVSGAEPLFFLDYFATGRLRPELASTVVAGIAEGCRQAGCALIGGETAEMPGMYKGEDYDLAGFAVGVVERDRIIDGSRIGAGHKVLGLASSGPHSNGYSLIRKVLERTGADPATDLPGPDGSTGSLGRALLAPTRIYVPLILELLKTHAIDGLAHITGGGLTENVVRVLPDGLGLEIDTGAWTPPPVFGWLQEHGRIAPEEMLRTFNQGIGMTLVVAPGQRAEVKEALRACGEAVFEIGTVTAHREGPRVRFLDT